MIDHGIRALATVLNTRSKKNLLTLTTRLKPEHFTDQRQRLIFSMLDQYFLSTGGLLKLDALVDVLESKGWDAGRILPIEETYNVAAALEVSDDEAVHSVAVLKQALAHERTGQAIARSYEILDNGATIDGEEVKGDVAARNFLLGELADIDAADAETMPEGSVAASTLSILEAYKKAKTGISKGVPTGFPTLDEATGGLNSGELILVAGYTSHGKSQTSVQMAWHAAVVEGRSVYYGTTETLKHQIEARILARHSLLPQFGLPAGLDSKKIIQGSLNKAEEKVFVQVLEDLRDNDAYGNLHITQMGRDSRLSTVAANMTRVNQQHPLDVAVIDSLNLLMPDRKRSSQREEFNDLLQAGKRLASSFDGGRGVALVSPWQVSVAAYVTALEEGGRYTLQKSLGETQEAQRSSDTVITIMHNQDQPRKAVMQVLKTRNAEAPEPIPLTVDYRCSFLTEGEAVEESTTTATAYDTEAFANLLGT